MSASSDDEENTFQGQVSAYTRNRACARLRESMDPRDRPRPLLPVHRAPRREAFRARRVDLRVPGRPRPGRRVFLGGGTDGEQTQCSCGNRRGTDREQTREQTGNRPTPAVPRERGYWEQTGNRQRPSLWPPTARSPAHPPVITPWQFNASTASVPLDVSSPAAQTVLATNTNTTCLKHLKSKPITTFSTAGRVWQALSGRC